MMYDARPFELVWKCIHGESTSARAVSKFVSFLERKLGGKFVYDGRKIPFGRENLIKLFEKAAHLQKTGVVTNLRPELSFPDEPPLFHWVISNETGMAGGTSIDNDNDALIPALAEALERYIWHKGTDHFVNPKTKTVLEIAQRGPFLHPESFVGFNTQQRLANGRLTILPESKFLWIDGYSYTQRKIIRLPAQLASGRHHHKSPSKEIEPMILATITNGLATGPTKEFALLNGAMELVERDAFMITWLNQLTPPQVSIDMLCKKYRSISKLVTLCKKYKLKPTFLLMPTDAPAYAVCAVIEDQTNTGPSITVGLKAGRSLESAVKGACLEALRMRGNIRFNNKNKPLDPNKPVKEINHTERAQYWSLPNKAEKLRFLTSGPETEVHEYPWEKDTTEEHWQRFLDWCQKEDYQCVSVDLTKSKFNVTDWHVHMVVMPNMQPMYQNESLIYLGGERLKTIPKKFGYTPREEPYQEEPHPFA